MHTSSFPVDPERNYPTAIQTLCPPACYTMSGFDDPGVYYSDSFGGGEGPGADEGGQKRTHIKKRFREFLRQFRVGTDRTGFTYKYR